MGRAVRRLGNTANVIHGFIYFVPEADEEYDKVGVTASRQRYFGSRAAPMGAVSAEVVMATFFNFSHDVVAEGIPGAWQNASPETLQQARLTAAARVLGRVEAALSPADVDEATEIASAMVNDAPMAGRPLAASNRGVELTDDPAHQAVAAAHGDTRVPRRRTCRRVDNQRRDTR